MKQGIHARAGLSEQELAEIRELWKLCNEHDHIDIKLNWGMLSSRTTDVTNDYLYYENDQLIGFLAIYSFLSTEVEISGMVHPAARRRGIFSQLAQTSIAECRLRAVPKLIFINERDSACGKAFLTNFGARYSFSEYVMELQEEAPKVEGKTGSEIHMRSATHDDIELLVALNVSGFAMPEEDARAYVQRRIEDEEWMCIAELGDARDAIGKIGVTIEAGAQAHIFGFCVLPEHRGQGYGRQILRQIIKDAKERRQAKSVKLEVAATNEGALGLYQSCGFQVKHAQDYYELLLV